MGALKWLRKAQIVLIPAVIFLLNCAMGLWLSVKIDNALLAEKMVEKRLDIDLICAQIDDYVERDNDWDTYDYSAALRRSMAYLDEQPMTYAGMFDEDMRDISQRTESYAGSPFEPMADLSFVDAACRNDHGDYIMPFTPRDEKTRDMHIYYRWVPSDRALTGRYLLVVAISSYSVTTPVSTQIVSALAVNIISALIVVIVYAAKSIRLGYIYDMREGDPWRGEIDES